MVCFGWEHIFTDSYISLPLNGNTGTFLMLKILAGTITPPVWVNMYIVTWKIIFNILRAFLGLIKCKN